MELSRNVFFSYFSDKDLEFVMKNASVKEFSAGEIIFFQGERRSSFNILLDGFVKLYKVVNDKEFFFEIRLPYQTIGFDSACYEAENFCTAEVICKKASILTIDFNTLKEAFGGEEFFVSACFAQLRTNHRDYDNAITNCILLNAKAKEARMILQNVALFNQINNKIIANVLNIAPETLSRIITSLSSENIIRVYKKRIVDFDEERLKELL